MAATRTREPRLSDEDVAKVIALIKGSDSVELKLTVPETEHSSTVAALEMDPLDAQIRQVFFFDTPELTLYEHGVVARARRVQKKGDDSVVKLRPVVPSDLPAPVRKLPEFGVEVDAMPGGFVCSGSMKGVPGPDVRETIMGKRRKSKLFSKAQQAFFTEHAPEGIELDDLSVLGPIFVLKLKYAPKAFDRSWSPRCGSTPTALGFSSSRPSARPTRRSRSQRRRGRSWRERASTSAASRRRRRARPSSSSPSG